MGDRFLATRTGAVLTALVSMALQVRRGLGPLGIKGLFSPADLLLPVLLPVLAHRQGWWRPRWRLPHLEAWLAAVTLMLVLSLLWGRVQMGEWFSWAVVNKAGGWGFLVAYLVAGAYLGADPTLRERCLRWSVLAGTAVAAVSLLLFLARPLVVMPGTYVVVDSAQRITGLQANPSSFALLEATLLLMMLAAARARRLMSVPTAAVATAILFIAVLLAGSRSVWVGLAVGLLMLAVLMRVGGRRILILAALLGGVTAVVLAVLYATSNGNLVYVTESAVLGMRDLGTTQRFQQFSQALAMWREHPLAGAGLGSFFHAQIASGGTDPQTIHNTALWLLAETGLTGFAVVFAFAAAVARRLWLDREDWMVAGALAVLAMFCTASVTTEVFYQRPLWLILGMALVVPAQRSTAAGP